MAFINHPYYTRQMIPMVGQPMMGAPIMMIPRPQTSSSDDLEKRIKDHVDKKINEAVSKLPSGTMPEPINENKLKQDIITDIQNYIKGEEVMKHFGNRVIALPLLDQYINERITEVNRQIQQIMAHHARYGANIQAMEQKIADLQQASESNSETLRQLQEGYRGQQRHMTQLQDETAASTEKCANLQKEIDALNKIFENAQIYDFKKQVEQRLKDLDNQKIGHNAFNNEIDRLDRAFAAHKKATDEMITRTIAQQLKTIKDDIAKRHDQLVRNYGELASLYGNLDAQIQTQQAQIAEILGTETGVNLTTKLHQIAKELAALQQSKSDYETSIDARLQNIVDTIASNPSVKRAIMEVTDESITRIQDLLEIYDDLNNQYEELLAQVNKTKSEGLAALNDIAQRLTKVEQQIRQTQKEGQQMVEQVLMRPDDFTLTQEQVDILQKGEHAEIEAHGKAITAPQQTVQEYLNERCATDPGKCNVNDKGLQINYGDVDKMCKRSSICVRGTKQGQCFGNKDINSTRLLDEKCIIHEPSAVEQSKIKKAQEKAQKAQEKAQRQEAQRQANARQEAQRQANARRQEAARRQADAQRQAEAEARNYEEKDAKMLEEATLERQAMEYFRSQQQQQTAYDKHSHEIDEALAGRNVTPASDEELARELESMMKPQAEEQARKPSLRPKSGFIQPLTPEGVTAGKEQLEAQKTAEQQQRMKTEMQRTPSRAEYNKYYTSQNMYGGSMLTSSEEVDSIVLSETSAN